MHIAQRKLYNIYTSTHTQENHECRMMEIGHYLDEVQNCRDLSHCLKSALEVWSLDPNFAVWMRNILCTELVLDTCDQLRIHRQLWMRLPSSQSVSGHPHHPQITGFTDISIVVNSMPSIYWFSRYSPMTHQNARVQIHHWYNSILLVATMSLRKIILLVYGIALCSHRHINV